MHAPEETRRRVALRISLRIWKCRRGGDKCSCRRRRSRHVQGRRRQVLLQEEQEPSEGAPSHGGR